MRIQSIKSNGVNACRERSKQNKSQTTNTIKNTNSAKDKFESKISFCGYAWSQQKLNILNRGECGMKELGEYLHKTPDDEIKGASHITNFFGFKSETKSQQAFERLTLAIQKVKEYRAGLSDELSNLKAKEAREQKNVLEQKNKVTTQFTKLVQKEGEGEPQNITSGILIYSNLKTKNDEFTEWLSKETPACFKKIEYNNEEPLKTLKKITETAKATEASFKTTNKRTLLFVDKLDDLFTDYSTLEKRKLISKFKGVMKNLSNKYHTTILMKTTKPLDEFAESTIGSNDFTLKVRLKDGISSKDMANINKTEKELKRLDDKANNYRNDLMYYEKEDYEYKEDYNPGRNGDHGWENILWYI